MANELNIALDPATQTGLSVVARLYAAGAQVGADIALAEIGTSAVYSGDVPGATAAGDYGVFMYDDDTSSLLGTGSLGWDGSTEATTRTVQLADGAITAAKFDESTAFPLKSADTGATQVARTGADGDTLETLSDQADLQATAANQSTLLGRTSAGVQVVVSEAQSGVLIQHLHVNQGDDHTDALGNALQWTTSDAETWPDLDGSGVAISFTMDRNDDNADATAGAAELSATGSVITGTGATKQVRVELTAAETATLDTGVAGYDYQLRATIGGEKRTLARGTITVHKAPIDD